MSRAFLTPIGASPLASNPGSGTEGDVYYNTTDDSFRYYTGSVWVSVATAADLASIRAEIPIFWPEEVQDYLSLLWPTES